jgi:hypothetical protein
MLNLGTQKSSKSTLSMKTTQMCGRTTFGLYLTLFSSIWFHFNSCLFVQCHPGLTLTWFVWLHFGSPSIFWKNLVSSNFTAHLYLFESWKLSTSSSQKGLEFYYWFHNCTGIGRESFRMCLFLKLLIWNLQLNLEGVLCQFGHWIT